MSKVIAVACSDIHFSHTPPPARANEPDWYKAMEYTFGQVKQAAMKHKVPILVAGDVFDKWNSPPELINFVISQFEGVRVVSVAGQHDLPNHSERLKHRSAYGVLASLNNFWDLTADKIYVDEGLIVYGVPWGAQAPDILAEETKDVRVALLHRYVWIGKHKYQEADKDTHMGRFIEEFKNYDTVIIGDNHKRWEQLSPFGTQFWNCGGLMRRKSDEVSYQPRYLLIHDDNTIEAVSLQTTGEQLDVNVKEKSRATRDFGQFLKSLGELSLKDSLVSEVFSAMIRNDDIRKGVRDILEAAYEEVYDADNR